MLRLDPFNIHSLIPLAKKVPETLVWAVHDSFIRTLHSHGQALTGEEASLLDGLIRVTYLQASFDGVKPSISELLKICGQAASDEPHSGFRNTLLILGTKLARTYCRRIRSDELQAT